MPTKPTDNLKFLRNLMRITSTSQKRRSSPSSAHPSRLQVLVIITSLIPFIVTIIMLAVIANYWIILIIPLFLLLSSRILTTSSEQALIRTVFKIAETQQREEAKTDFVQKTPSLLADMHKQKWNKINHAYLAFSLFLLIYMTTNSLASTRTDWKILVVTFFLMTTLGLRQIIRIYRIRNGYFGTSEREAREVIAFILKEADRIDPDGNGTRKLVDQMDFAKEPRVTARMHTHGFLRTGE